MKKPLDLREGDVLPSGATVKGVSRPDFRNEVVVWVTESDGTKGRRIFNIIRTVEAQDS